MLTDAVILLPPKLRLTMLGLWMTHNIGNVALNRILLIWP
jgi:hypothetical protein